jgi:hypothetical protein
MTFAVRFVVAKGFSLVMTKWKLFVAAGKSPSFSWLPPITRLIRIQVT